MKNTFLASSRGRASLSVYQFPGLLELGQALGLPVRQLPASSGRQGGQGRQELLPSNQRFAQAR